MNIIGLNGTKGSGKTTLAHKLAAISNQSALVVQPSKLAHADYMRNLNPARVISYESLKSTEAGRQELSDWIRSKPEYYMAGLTLGYSGMYINIELLIIDSIGDQYQIPYYERMSAINDEDGRFGLIHLESEIHNKVAHDAGDLNFYGDPRERVTASIETAFPTGIEAWEYLSYHGGRAAQSPIVETEPDRQEVNAILDLLFF